MTGIKNALSPVEAIRHYAGEHPGGEVPLPDVVDAVAGMASTDTDTAKSAIFWLIDKGGASLTPAFMVAFPDVQNEG